MRGRRNLGPFAHTFSAAGETARHRDERGRRAGAPERHLSVFAHHHELHPVGGGDQDAQTFTVLDVAVPAANDYVIRKLYSTTIALRNLTI